MASVILGVYKDRPSADEAINQLEGAGFDSKDISVIVRNEEGETVSSTGDSVTEGAVSGATTGGVLGGLAGLLIGLGVIAIPGVGGLLVGGPLAIALGLTGAAATTVSGAVTGALAGGLVGGLVGLGVPEEEARIYESRIKEGAVLVAVPVQNKNGTEARAILDSTGADQIRTVSLKDN